MSVRKMDEAVNCMCYHVLKTRLKVTSIDRDIYRVNTCVREGKKYNKRVVTELYVQGNAVISLWYICEGEVSKFCHARFDQYRGVCVKIAYLC